MLRVSEPESDIENNTKDTAISAPSPDICAKVSFKFYHIYTVMYYGKFSKISNTFLFLFSNKMLIFRAGIHKKHVRIANREYPDQTASSEAV